MKFLARLLFKMYEISEHIALFPFTIIPILWPKIGCGSIFIFLLFFPLILMILFFGVGFLLVIGYTRFILWGIWVIFHPIRAFKTNENPFDKRWRKKRQKIKLEEKTNGS